MERLNIELPEELIDLIVARASAALIQQRTVVPEPWVGIEEASQHLACKRQRIYDLVARRTTSGIPHRKGRGAAAVPSVRARSLARERRAA